MIVAPAVHRQRHRGRAGAVRRRRSASSTCRRRGSSSSLGTVPANEAAAVRIPRARTGRRGRRPARRARRRGQDPRRRPEPGAAAGHAPGPALAPRRRQRRRRPGRHPDDRRRPGLRRHRPASATAERSALVAERVPVLAEALPFIGHVSIRNRGTIGGSIAHADAAAELPAVAVVTGAELVVRSTPRRAGRSRRRLLRRPLHAPTWTTTSARRGPGARRPGRRGLVVPRDRPSPRRLRPRRRRRHGRPRQERRRSARRGSA